MERWLDWVHQPLVSFCESSDFTLEEREAM